MNKDSKVSSVHRLSLIAKKIVGESLLMFQYPSSWRRDLQSSALVQCKPGDKRRTLQENNLSKNKWHRIPLCSIKKQNGNEHTLFPLQVPSRKTCTLKRFDLNISHDVKMWGSWKLALFLDGGPDFVIYLACYYFSCFFQSRKGSFEEMCFLDTLIHQSWSHFKYFSLIYTHTVVTASGNEPTLPVWVWFLVSICVRL